MENYLENLNERQLEAVNTLDGPLLVLAGAGTGKTRVLVSRFVHLLKTKKLNPEQILSVTFTNKAAKEMQNRIQNLVGQELPYHWIGTFHGLCLQIIKQNLDYLPIDEFFTIADKSDQKNLIKKVLQKFNIESNLAGYVLDQIDQFKNHGKQKPNAGDFKIPGVDEQALFEEYQKELITSNACDFNDLILYCLQLWQENPKILDYYQEKLPYLMVDEYQDTNWIQYQWLSLLAKKYNNICCVGDEDQTIYSWRGASINNILNFHHDFQNSKTILLEENYRSNQAILDVANCIIARNKQRLGKKIFAHNESILPVRIISTFNEKAEANLVVGQIQKLQYQGYKLSEIAILVRATFQIGALEETLFYQSIPYQVVGSRKFYEFHEIKDLVSYLGLIYNNNANMYLSRIINIPKRGIGTTSMAKIQTYAENYSCSFYIAIKRMLGEGIFSKKVQQSLEEFVRIIDHYTIYHKNLPLDELLILLLKDLQYVEQFLKTTNNYTNDSMNNINELMRILKQYDSLAKFIEHIALMADIDNFEGKNDSIKVMTIHAAKGLEFNIVFLTGWEDGIMPYKQFDNKTKDLEEERRLAYVAMTRAKNQCYITYCRSRVVFNQTRHSSMSQFLFNLNTKSAKFEYL